MTWSGVAAGLLAVAVLGWVLWPLIREGRAREPEHPAGRGDDEE